MRRHVDRRILDQIEVTAFTRVAVDVVKTSIESTPSSASPITRWRRRLSDLIQPHHDRLCAVPMMQVKVEDDGAVDVMRQIRMHRPDDDVVDVTKTGRGVSTAVMAGGTNGTERGADRGGMDEINGLGDGLDTPFDRLDRPWPQIQVVGVHVRSIGGDFAAAALDRSGSVEAPADERAQVVGAWWRIGAGGERSTEFAGVGVRVGDGGVDEESITRCCCGGGRRCC